MVNIIVMCYNEIKLFKLSCKIYACGFTNIVKGEFKAVNVTRDEQIIDALFERDENILEQISNKYKKLYISVLRQILGSEEDVVECENDVLLAVWNSIPPNKPDNLAAYISKLARNISINRFKYNTRQKRGVGYTVVLHELSECIPDSSSGNDYTEYLKDKELEQILTDFVKSLDDETRVLFVRRYFYLESVGSLAKRYGFTENKVSVKLYRARNKLHKILQKEAIII